MRNHPDFPHDPFVQAVRGNAPLPPRRVNSLAELDLDAELALLYSNANHLYTETCNASEIPANQKAQTLNTILSILKEALNKKEQLYNVAEVTLIEVALGETLKNFPDISEAFLREYKGRLNL